MEENSPMLGLTKATVNSNWFTFFISIMLVIPKIDFTDVTTKEISIWLGILIILFVVSSAFDALISNKYYVYEDSILNTIPREIPIIAITLNSVGLIGLLFSSLLSLPAPLSGIFMYIGILLILLSFSIQIYYYSKMKIIYFFILLTGLFLTELLFLPPYHVSYIASGVMKMFVVLGVMWLISDIVIYKSI